MNGTVALAFHQMLVNGDFKAMEWLTAVYLSQDQVGLYELEHNIDQHTDNQKRQGLPEGKEGRFIAKIFLFRLIFGGSAFAYAMDPDFSYISNDPKYWQRAIEVFYEKYRGLQSWHTEIVREVMENGKYVLPTGRTFYYQPFKGDWPRTKILNYPVQGLGAELMTIARVILWRKMRKAGLQAKMIATVHDSILIDCPDPEVDYVSEYFYQTWDEIPEAFLKMTDHELNVTPRVEVQVGPNWADMEDKPRAN